MRFRLLRRICTKLWKTCLQLTVSNRPSLLTVKELTPTKSYRYSPKSTVGNTLSLLLNSLNRKRSYTHQMKIYNVTWTKRVVPYLPQIFKGSKIDKTFTWLLVRSRVIHSDLSLLLDLNLIKKLWACLTKAVGFFLSATYMKHLRGKAGSSPKKPVGLPLSSTSIKCSKVSFGFLCIVKWSCLLVHDHPM